jgi:hypothetical protein
MALILNSPARDAAVGSSITADQRGFPIVRGPDIGAYEAGTFSNYNAWIWEMLPSSATVAQHDMSADYDGDGITNGNEYIALTNPGDPASLFRITNFTRSGNTVNITFTSAVGRNDTIEVSDGLVGWGALPIPSIAGTGSPIDVPVQGVNCCNRLFFRVRVGP